MPENKVNSTPEEKKTDAPVKAPATPSTEGQKPSVAPKSAQQPKAPTAAEKKLNDPPKEPPKAPPAPPTTPPPPPPKVPPKQAETPKAPAAAQKPVAEQKSTEKVTPPTPKVTTPVDPPKAAEKKVEEKKPESKTAAPTDKATAPKDSSKPEEKKADEKKPEEKKADAKAPAAKPTATPPAAPKKGEEKSASEKAGKTVPATDPKKPDTKAQATDPQSKPADVPKKDEVNTPLKVTGKDKVEIPIPPKPAEKSDSSTAPKVTQPTPLGKETTSPQGEPKAKEAAAPTQAAEGPKGIVISQVFDDRLAPPSAADLKSLPTPKEGEAFSMRLHPAYFFEFLEHPFTINRETKDYKDLYESIKENGIHDPVYCRPRKDGGLEIMSGHRRHDIGTQLNYPIPTIIVQADDDTARIAVVDGNLHRLDIPTSELARAAKMKMEALTRKAGRRSKLDQLTAPQKRSDQQVAEDMGMSRNQVQRLVRIDSLVPELKQQVDEKKLPFNTAVELSYMKPDEQKKVVDYMEKEQVTPSMSQATQLKEASKHAETLAKHMPTLAPANQVNEEKIASIIKPKKEPELKVTLTADELRSYFPGKLPTVPEAKRVIFDALDLRKKALEKQAKKQDIKLPAR